MTAPLAAVEGVRKHYGRTEALRGVSLSLAAGECLALVGHNGSGKSTLMKLLLGLIRPQAGRVTVFGESPSGRAGRRLRAGLGFLPENVAFDPGMTGRQVLRFYTRLKRLPPSTVEPLLERVGLAAAADRPTRGYSKGMRQRLGLAQALAGTPRLLLLDEPTTGLDPALRRRFYGIVEEVKAAGSAVLISSHALSELEAQADRVAMLAGGRLVAAGTLAEVRRAADLPLRLRVRVKPCHSQRVLQRLRPPHSAERLDPERLVLSCREADKMAVLHDLLQLGDWVCDVETLPASLDQVYARLAEGAAR